jgi:diguanylate cyclase (GGDEF)-like protein
VLVAEDDADLRELLLLRLRNLGFAVTTTADGGEALASALLEPPDLAVFDVMMPVLDGLELTRRLRAHPATAELPIVLVTARTTGEDVALGFEAGATDYIRKPYTQPELRARLAAALQRAQLVDRLASVARIDELTGLPNRRAWDEGLLQQLARAARAAEPVCLAVLDLDEFKAYNDLHGHQAGDRLLAEAAGAWRATLRQGDLLARYGGEEFAVLLPDCRLRDAGALLERLRAATPLGQTLSAGVAQWDHEESGAALLGRADEALYDAKRQGRDRVIAG